jgi:polyvinyl alcohol dehydrogenase (cytochrome)
MRTSFVLAAFWILASPSAARADERSSGDWPMYNHDVRGTRHSEDTHLSPFNIGALHVLWNFPTPAPVTGTAVTAGDDVFVGDWSGAFYSLDANSGHVDWQAQAIAPISASALVLNDRVFFGDQAGFIYGLDRRTGAVAWQVQPNPHPLAAIFSSPTPVGRNIVIGIASNEEDAAGDPSYPCCSFRGSVVMLDPANGHVVWQTYFISDAESAAGSSGAAVWGTPTYDHESGLIYVSTGNNYSAPSNGLEDSVIALDAKSGHIVWVNQAVSNDVANFGLPIEPDKDSDYGDSPQIYRLWSGRKVVSAGNKNGIFYVMDAASGELVGAKRLQTGGSLGGLFADSAEAYGIVFTNGADWPDPFNFDVLPNAGILTAVSGDGMHVLWQKQIAHEVTLSGLAVANGVVYAASCNPGTGDRLTNNSGTVLALNALTGQTLASIPTAKCANGGPSIAHGRVFVGLGNEYLFAGSPTGNVLALGL